MEFDELVVKESPGLCRCCLSEGCYKDLGSEYTWMSETEVYADMLLECFDISITQHTEGPNGPSRLICEVCITRLRDACNFKKQVLDSEKKFVDMVGRGEFGQKVMIYQTSMRLEGDGTEAGEVEYLDDDMHFDDADDEPLRPPTESTQAVPEPSASDEIIISTLKVKGKRGRPRKVVTDKVEKKPKLSRTEDKPMTSKAVKAVKGKPKLERDETFKLPIVRGHITTLLHYGKLTPFNWSTKGFRCSYCDKPMKDCETLKLHVSKHQKIDPKIWTKKIISKDIPLKVDISELSCKVCDEDCVSLDDLITHISMVHGEELDRNIPCVFPFKLNRNIMQCALCESSYDNFMSMLTHMYKAHTEHSYICQICGTSFLDQSRLNRHINHVHIGHKCVTCSKVFDAVHKLDRHKERIHGQKKIHDCNLCSETFENNYQVKVHMGKVHNVEKYRIKCDFCPKITTTKGAMVLHIQSMHSDSKYECEYCPYKTGIKWMIKLHQRKHFGEKNYVCSVCEKRFGRSSNVRAHMKVHTGGFGRVCRWCRHGFPDEDTLRKHELETHYYEQYT